MIRDNRRFRCNEFGGVLIFWALGIVAFLGFVALSFDVGRIANTQTEMQTLVDEVALAAGGEIDRLPGAQERALAAADDLIRGKIQTFGDGGQLLDRGRALSTAECDALVDAGGDPADCDGDFTVAFLDAAGGPALTDATTRFVRVTAVPRRVQTPLSRGIALLTGGSGLDFFDARATATAGATTYACEPVRFGFCVNPDPAAGYDPSALEGRQIRIADFGSGNSGLLDMSSMYPNVEGPCSDVSVNGVGYEVCMYGAEGATSGCFEVGDGLDTEPGTKGGNFLAAINTRFDIYTGVTNNDERDIDYRPAPNVVRECTPQGNSGNNGNGNGNNGGGTLPAASLPRDSCFDGGGCTTIGDGDWTAGRADYLLTNYGPLPDGGDTPEDFPGDLADWVAVSTASTRWELYLAELAAADGGDILENRCITGVPETPGYAAAPVSADGPGRRLMVGAAVDCASGIDINGRTQDVPAADYFLMFLTEPADGGNEDIWLEVVQEIPTDGTESLIYRVVRLLD
ncbi:MAG: Tad domain-containing protein [Rhodobacteraceae bacterium]|nr:Tad domain-containing protein [Paracoccaceae bacterium]